MATMPDMFGEPRAHITDGRCSCSQWAPGGAGEGSGLGMAARVPQGLGQIRLQSSALRDILGMGLPPPGALWVPGASYPPQSPCPTGLRVPNSMLGKPQVTMTPTPASVCPTRGAVSHPKT